MTFSIVADTAPLTSFSACASQRFRKGRGGVGNTVNLVLDVSS